MSWCANCTCCEVRQKGDFCIFCEEGLVCPRQRQKARLAEKAQLAAQILEQRKPSHPSRVEEERSIRSTARRVEKEAASEGRRKAREQRRARSIDRILAERQAKERARAERKLKRASDNFISKIAATALPAQHQCKDCGDSIVNGNFCPACRSKRHIAGRSKSKKYIFTAEMDERIRLAYSERTERKFSLKGTLAKEFGFPDWTITKRGCELGLARTKEKPWTTPERDLLQEHGWKTDDRISDIFRQHGFRRSPAAIHVMLARHPKGKRELYPFYSATKAGVLFGIDSHSITAWIGRGWLRASRLATDRTAKQGGDPWAIYPYDIYQFIKEHPTEFDLRKVDQFWFLELLFDESKRREPDRFDVYSSSYLPYEPVSMQATA